MKGRAIGVVGAVAVAIALSLMTVPVYAAGNVACAPGAVEAGCIGWRAITDASAELPAVNVVADAGRAVTVSVTGPARLDVPWVLRQQANSEESTFAFVTGPGMGTSFTLASPSGQTDAQAWVVPDTGAPGTATVTVSGGPEAGVYTVSWPAWPGPGAAHLRPSPWGSAVDRVFDIPPAQGAAVAANQAVVGAAPSGPWQTQVQVPHGGQAWIRYPADPAGLTVSIASPGAYAGEVSMGVYGLIVPTTPTTPKQTPAPVPSPAPAPASPTPAPRSAGPAPPTGPAPASPVPPSQPHLAAPPHQAFPPQHGEHRVADGWPWWLLLLAAILAALAAALVRRRRKGQGR